MGQWSRRALPRNTGHTSSAQRVMTVSTVAGSIVCDRTWSAVRAEVDADLAP
jgi:hypothetical protein